MVSAFEGPQQYPQYDDNYYSDPNMNSQRYLLKGNHYALN